MDKNAIKEDTDGLFEHYKFVADPGQGAIRIDKYLMDKLEKISRNRIQNAARDNFVFVNNRPVKPSYKIQPRDEVRIAFPYEKKLAQPVIAEDIPLDIKYEDDHILIINKQAGIVVHPGIGNKSGTLVNAIAYHLQNSNLPIKPSNGRDRPGIVHRIDKDTTGLMVIAKTETAMSGLSKQFFDHSIEREYCALVWGNFDEPKGTITGNIARHKTSRLQMDVFEEPHIGRHAVTHYEVLEDMYYVSLVKCVLETGRTHQIRVHMKYKGHPLFNDWRYNGDRIWKGTVYSKYKQFVENCFKLLPRQALHARVLGFVHPATGENVRFEQELPSDFSDCLTKWRNYVNNRKDNN